MKYTSSYQTPHVLIMWGSDFSHLFASETFALADQLIDKLKDNPSPYDQVNIKFATISEYLNAVE